MDFLKQIAKSTPKMILGSNGKYFRIAESGSFELYVKLAFNKGKVFTTDNNTANAFICETNVLLVPTKEGDPPELQKPLDWIRGSVYKDGDVGRQGFLVAKLWMPTPISTLDISMMFKYLIQHQAVLRSYLDDKAVKPLGCEWVLDFAELLTLLSDDIKPFDLDVPVQIFTRKEYEKAYHNADSAQCKKYEAADQAPDDDEQGD